MVTGVCLTVSMVVTVTLLEILAERASGAADGPAVEVLVSGVVAAGGDAI